MAVRRLIRRILDSPIRGDYQSGCGCQPWVIAFVIVSTAFRSISPKTSRNLPRTLCGEGRFRLSDDFPRTRRVRTIPDRVGSVVVGLCG